jgi:hypothetical protein
MIMNYRNKINLKMKRAGKYLIYLNFLMLPFMAFNGQDCFYYHEYFCKFPNTSYFYSGQSRSALFAFGMISEFKFVTFGGEDYHISICYERKFKNVRLRLLEDNADKTPIYDNKDFNYQQTMSFSNNVARKLIIEISIPEDATGKEGQELHCVGVLIHFKKTYQEPQNKIGF